MAYSLLVTVLKDKNNYSVRGKAMSQQAASLSTAWLSIAHTFLP